MGWKMALLLVKAMLMEGGSSPYGNLIEVTVVIAAVVNSLSNSLFASLLLYSLLVAIGRPCSRSWWDHYILWRQVIQSFPWVFNGPS